MENATEGTIKETTYWWPRPGTDKPLEKIALYTKVGDQICSVGYYKNNRFSVEETADALQIAPPTVKTRLLRARRRLQAALAPALQTPCATRFLLQVKRVRRLQSVCRAGMPLSRCPLLAISRRQRRRLNMSAL